MRITAVWPWLALTHNSDVLSQSQSCKALLSLKEMLCQKMLLLEMLVHDNLFLSSIRCQSTGKL